MLVETRDNLDRDMHQLSLIPVLITASGRLPPRLGRVAAGLPLEAVEEQERGELLALLTSPGRYALQVGDDSMCEAGILHGDYVVVQSQQAAVNGDIVIALIDGEQVALGRIRYRADGQIELIAENNGGQRRAFAAARVDVQGKVVGQVRRYR